MPPLWSFDDVWNVAAAQPVVETQALQHCTSLLAYTLCMVLEEPNVLVPDLYVQADPMPFGVMDLTFVPLLASFSAE
jgi:hypothetical protein